MKKLPLIISFLLISYLSWSQVEEAWIPLEQGIEYKWVAKKKIKDTGYSVWKLKIRNTTDKFVRITFVVNEYTTGKLTARSDQEMFCLKPNFMDVLKIQLLDSGKPNSNEGQEIITEMNDVVVEIVDSCE